MKSIWFRDVQLGDLAKPHPDTMMEHLNILITEVGPDYLCGTMPVDKRTHQPFGLLHGGASVTLAETLGSLAALLVIDDRKQFCVGQEINANHIRGVREGLVSGTARPYYIGKTSHVWGIEIRDAQNQMACVSRLTMAIRDQPNKDSSE
jgi:1,4-dihydroxy-2-naphthoyl-CoA hydrolase